MIEERQKLCKKETILCHLRCRFRNGQPDYDDDRRIFVAMTRRNVVLFEQLLRQQLSSVQKITVLGISCRITYELWNAMSIDKYFMHIIFRTRTGSTTYSIIRKDNKIVQPEERFFSPLKKYDWLSNFSFITWQHSSCSWSYISWIYYYLCNQYISTLKWVRTPFKARCTRYNIMW